MTYEGECFVVPSEGFEPTLCPIKSRVPYRLGDEGWRRAEVVIPMHGSTAHPPLSRRRWAPAHLALRLESMVPALGFFRGFQLMRLASCSRPSRQEFWSRMAGVEPAFRSYQDRGLPLSDTGVVGTVGVESTLRSRQDRGLPLTYAPMVGLRRLARRNFLHPKQVGRCLPLSPECFLG